MAFKLSEQPVKGAFFFAFRGLPVPTHIKIRSTGHNGTPAQSERKKKAAIRVFKESRSRPNIAWVI